jgi:hypothetical protein
LKQSIEQIFGRFRRPGHIELSSREVVKRHPESKILLTSGFPGKQLADAHGVGSTVRLLSKPYRKDDLALLGSAGARTRRKRARAHETCCHPSEGRLVPRASHISVRYLQVDGNTPC